MPKTFVMSYLNFAKDEGCVAALENLESLQASLECILEATDQPIHALYASSLLTTVNDTIIVIQHIHLQELEHKIKEPGEEPRNYNYTCGPRDDIVAVQEEEDGVRLDILSDEDNPIRPECAECGQPIHQISYRCVDCIGRDG